MDWVRVAAASALAALGAAGLFWGYPAIQESSISGGLAVAFLVTGFGALGVKIRIANGSRDQ